jgi:hypothetical protein
MPGRLNNLGNSFLCRFECTGDLTDISEAISSSRKQFSSLLRAMQTCLSRLNNLGNSFLRFECTGDLTDISEAISSQQKAVQLTPEGHADMPAWLNNLGIHFKHALNTQEIQQMLIEPFPITNSLQLISLGHLQFDLMQPSNGLTVLRDQILIHSNYWRHTTLLFILFPWFQVWNKLSRSVIPISLIFLNYQLLLQPLHLAMGNMIWL